MKSILTLVGKDLRGFFASPIFYVVACVYSIVLMFYGFQLIRFNEALKNMMLSPGAPPDTYNIHFQVFRFLVVLIFWLFLFLIPALTMRLISEEKKNRTFDLLLTSPISSVQIVLAKYLAGLGAVAGLLAVSFMYPLVTAYFAKFSWTMLGGLFLGIFLVGAAFVAVDLFCSAVTESPLIAYVLSVVFNFSLLLVGFGAELADSPKVRAVFEHISVNLHFMNMAEGSIKSGSLIYFLTLIGLFIFLSERIIEAHRWR
ncbi:MAG: ABC transporter permease subunit [Pseudobdellovibrionaceae bacterium]